MKLFFFLRGMMGDVMVVLQNTNLILISVKHNRWRYEMPLHPVQSLADIIL